MTFIGIVIFTVYTKSVHYVGKCAVGSPTGICLDYMSSEPYEEGRYEPRYVGEFSTIEKCDAAVRDAKYSAKDHERVADGTEVMCLPKVISDSGKTP